jgi:hypothetical protein
MALSTIRPNQDKHRRTNSLSHCIIVYWLFCFSSFSLLLALSDPLLAQPIHFAEEKIVFLVRPGEVRVTGDYHFRNPGQRAVQASVLYPFPLREDQPFPDSITVIDVLDRTPCPFGRLDSALSFTVHVPPLTTRIYRVSFRQKVFAFRFEYILSTTRRWSAPVGQAEFVITLAKDLTLESMSIPAEEYVQNQGSNAYIIKKTDFESDRNLVVRWKRRRP